MKISKKSALYLAGGIIIVIGLVGLARQSHALQQSIETMKTAELRWVSLGLALVFGTFFVAAGTLYVLALKRIKYARTVLIQIAGGFATKLVPAGIGGIALNIRYLSKQKHSLTQAGSVIMLNNSLGFIGHVLILGVATILGTKIQSENFVQIPTWVFVLIGGVLVTAIIVFFSSNSLRLRVRTFWHDFKTIVKLYWAKPHILLLGLLFASVVTLLFAACLWCSANALAVHMNPVEVLWVLTIGLIGIGITPTPGGIGGAEAALTAALIATGMNIQQALPIALLYRLLSYWIPILPGLLAFQIALRKRLI